METTELGIGTELGISVAIGAISWIASMVGVGGAGLIIPFLFLIGRELDEVIPLSAAAVLGGSAVRIVYFITQRRIQYWTVLLFIPFDALFSYPGYALNAISPDWFLTAIIVVVLGVASAISFYKGRQLWHRERRGRDETDSQGENGDETNESENNNDLIFFMAAALITTSILFAAAYWRSSRPTCSDSYWLLTGIQGFAALVIGIAASTLFLESGKRWQGAKIVGFAGFTGFITTLIGIGGGMIIMPFMLHLGYIMETAVATNSAITFFSAISTTTQYALSGQMTADAFTVAMAAALGTCGGMWSNSYVIGKLQRRSYLVFVLVGITVVSNLALLVMGIVRTVQAGGFAGFDGAGLCSGSGSES